MFEIRCLRLDITHLAPKKTIRLINMNLRGGISEVESPRWNLRGGISGVESQRWNLRPNCKKFNSSAGATFHRQLNINTLQKYHPANLQKSKQFGRKTTIFSKQIYSASHAYSSDKASHSPSQPQNSVMQAAQSNMNHSKRLSTS